LRKSKNTEELTLDKRISGDTFAERTIKFYQSLDIGFKLPDGIGVMNPYLNQDVIEICGEFYGKYYDDSRGRRLILGINPGRFGAGVTGIPFTDPIRLEKECGIENAFPPRPELSSEFIYRLIDAMGGAEHFYRHYYIGAVSPLGFVRNGKNFNYYDSKELMQRLKPFIVRSLVDQIGLGITSRKCYCLGQGKNYEYLKTLNEELRLFDEIIPLPHPRWVMQYRRKSLEDYILQSVKILSV
jgi:hypothetical protein